VTGHRPTATIPRLVAGALLVALALSAALGCSKDSPTAPAATDRALLGLLANPSDFHHADSIASSLAIAVATGSRFHLLTPLWREVETSPASIDLSQMNLILSVYQAYGLERYVNLRLIDTNSRGCPGDLQSLAWDDPAMVARVDVIVDSLAVLARAWRPVAVALGNEVDGYFEGHPAEFTAFQALYAREVARLHAQVPGLRVGIVSTSHAVTPLTTYADSLDRFSDIRLHTFYPLIPGSDFVQRDPSTLAAELDAIVARAGGKPVGFQEVGYSSNSVNNGSPAKQAAFVRAFKGWLAAQPRARVAFASYFLMTDWSSATLHTLYGYYGFVSPGFAGYLGGLGLRDTTGAAKPAWDAWRGM
jgi:hypothetical protein